MKEGIKKGYRKFGFVFTDYLMDRSVMRGNSKKKIHKMFTKSARCSNKKILSNELKNLE